MNFDSVARAPLLVGDVISQRWHTKGGLSLCEVWGEDGRGPPPTYEIIKLKNPINRREIKEKEQFSPLFDAPPPSHGRQSVGAPVRVAREASSNIRIITARDDFTENDVPVARER